MRLKSALSPSCLLVFLCAQSIVAQDVNWPPALPDADRNGVVRLHDEGFIKTPDDVAKAAAETGFNFTVAKTPPTVDLVLHGNLPDAGVGPRNGTGWTSWGDICVAGDGSVYVAIGDHGVDGTRKKAGEPSDAHVFVYRWLPSERVLKQVAAPNKIVGAGPDDPNWSKIHAGIHEGVDGKIYFVPTFNGGQRAPDAPWTDRVPTGQIFQFDPKTETSKVVGLLPPNSATATSEYDRTRNLLYINLEGAHNNALFAFDLTSMKPVHQTPDATIGQNRNMALANDGAIYFNLPPLGPDEKQRTAGGIGKYDPTNHEITNTGMQIPGYAAMRSSTTQTKTGWIYATTYGGEKGHKGQLIRFHPEQKKVETLGHDFLAIGRRDETSVGNYTTVCLLSPDEKYVYYLPGAHGGAFRIGTPVVQYNIATGEHKIIAFLRDVIESQTGYTPAGTYGIAISADGSKLYANLNGHASAEHRRERMREIGFGLTGFVVVEIPADERR